MIDYDILFSNSFRRLKGNIIRELYKWTNQPGFISFAGGNPDPSTFPNEALAELTRKNLLEKGTQCLQYGVSMELSHCGNMLRRCSRAKVFRPRLRTS